MPSDQGVEKVVSEDGKWLKGRDGVISQETKPKPRGIRNEVTGTTGNMWR